MSTTTLTTHVQPRRRAARGSDQTPDVVHKDANLPKGSTFHQSKQPHSLAADPIINFKTLPSRSLTSPEALQDLVNKSDKRVDDIIASFDRSLSGIGQDKPLTTNDHSDLDGAGRAATSVYQPLSKASFDRGRHVLSEYAAKVIKLHIIDPLVEEESLKEFHPLVKGLPQRIASHQVRCLRDLEKVLIFLAPHTAKSAASYLDFCEISIQCIHTTVDHLNEIDQRRPLDRPYTNNYFVDLVGQVRQYAQIMANSRAKKANGQSTDEVDVQPGEKIVLRGGVSEGKPLELVRELDGKQTTIDAPRIEIDDEIDDDVQRSMARKRKCDIGKVEYRACRECGKVYTRPCDLTKHEKTHSRPWKCSDESCKYYELGWPTEKERDRHMNDKHSSAPALYHCLWKDKGCAYTSKRESNCKQHMEKAHGWDYVRSKTKRGTKLVASAASPTVQLMATPMSEQASTPSSNQSYDGHSPASGFSHNASNFASPQASNFTSPPEFSFNDYDKGFAYQGFLSPQLSEGRQSSVPIAESYENPTFEQTFGYQNVNLDWSTIGAVFPQYNIPQQPTPIGSDFEHDFDLNPSKSNQQSLSSEFSPAASDAVLFGNDVLMQESQGYIDFATQAKSGQDFSLFGEIPRGGSADDTAAMFPDIDMGAAFAEVDAGMFDQMTEEEMDRYLYGDGM